MARKLLLADDSITVQRVIELTFSDEGLEIATVGDGTQAIERLARDRPDIVLADLSMPGADGYAVAEYVKRGSDLVAHTRVVLLTGTFEPVDPHRAKSLGVDGVLEKPFEPRMAIELVRTLLEQPPLAPPRVERPVSDWTADVGTHAAGYPFEPGTTTGRSSPAELDDYFKRLDEALANAGLKASPAVRDMLAESRESMSVATVTPQDGPAPPGLLSGSSLDGSAPMLDASSFAPAPSTSAAAPASTPVTAPPQGASLPGTSMPGTPLPGTSSVTSSSGSLPSGSSPVTLVDAFSALLAAEQGEGDAAQATVLAAWAPAPPVSPAPPAPQVADSEPTHVQPSLQTSTSATPDRVSVDRVFVEPAPVDPAAVARAIPGEVLEAVVRRVLAEIGDRLVREVVSAKVTDVAERLVREEIERLKAAAADE